jgi:hypothetical protein
MKDGLATSRYTRAELGMPSVFDQEPPLGSHLTTSRRGYTHHGVYAGRDRVIHYAGLSGFGQCGPVEQVSLLRFAGGRDVRVVQDSRSSYMPQEILRRARSRLGENDYRLMTNNCEHFCNWCRSGVSHSAQVQRLPFRLLGALVSFVTDASKFAIR